MLSGLAGSGSGLGDVQGVRGDSADVLVCWLASATVWALPATSSMLAAIWLVVSDATWIWRA